MTDSNDDTVVTAIAVEETPTNTFIQELLKQMQEMRAELKTVKGELTSVKQQLEQEREKNAKKPYDPFSGSNSVNPSHKPSTATNSSSSSSARNATDKPSHAQGQWKTPLEIPPGDKTYGIFINDSLTPATKQLFAMTRELARNNRNFISGCWTFNGDVCVRAKATGKVYKIKKFTQYEFLKRRFEKSREENSSSSPDQTHRSKASQSSGSSSQPAAAEAVAKS
eukprot:g57714.t1